VLELAAAQDLGSSPARLLGKPADKSGRIGREEKIVTGGEVDVFQRGRIEPDAVNAARELRRRIDLVGCLLDQDAGGVDARTRFRLGLDDDSSEPAECSGARADEPRETRADDDEVNLPQARSPLA
jgi:hypothetical protein